MYCQTFDLLQRYPRRLFAFAASPENASGWPGAEAYRELLANLAVVVSNDVLRVRVQADHPDDLALDASFFEDFADCCLG
jgi:hypothetical protein